MKKTLYISNYFKENRDILWRIIAPIIFVWGLALFSVHSRDKYMAAFGITGAIVLIFSLGLSFRLLGSKKRRPGGGAG